MATDKLRQLHTNESLIKKEISAAATAGVENGAFYHDPVMLNACLDALSIKENGVYADCTLGGGGHSYAITQRLSDFGTLHAFDRDEEAIAFAKQRLLNVRPQVVFHAVPFAELGKEIGENELDGVLYDLGISSHQVDDSRRGFTFVGENPLDLRMDKREAVSAQEFLRTVETETLAHALKKNADLERSLELSAKIIEVALKKYSRNEAIVPLDIKSCIEAVFPDKKRDVNSLLARVFQAIRMEINRELYQIETSLSAAVHCLKPHGRLVVMSYHSVEDRTVKETCKKFETECICPSGLPVCTCGGKNRKLLKINKKPILPSIEEICKNPRARSAKLRVYERV